MKTEKETFEIDGLNFETVKEKTKESNPIMGLLNDSKLRLVSNVFGSRVVEEIKPKDYFKEWLER